MVIQQTSQKEACILESSGHIDFNARNDIHNAMKTAMASGSRHILFNLKGITFIDSAGLGLLMLASKECNTANVRFSLCQPEKYVKDVLALTNINQQIPIFDSLEQALSH